MSVMRIEPGEPVVLTPDACRHSLIYVNGYKVQWTPKWFSGDEVRVWHDVPWLHFPRRWKAVSRKADGFAMLVDIVKALGGLEERP
jgi:hypothetical protein